MKTLALLRHAKSSWADPTCPDFERPLNRRGQRDAPRMAQRLVQHLGPSTVWISPAVRTQATWALLWAVHPLATTVHHVPEIYEASAEDLLGQLRQASLAVGSLVVIGHAPGLPDLAALLTGGPPLAFPTCAFVILRCEVGTWASLAPGCATQLHYGYPKDGVD
ncbi:MAG: histidine phosphatase family protein [Bacteroidia bacterium]|nr:histidine phosphatase family protein [Bacteroidia bacterium]